MFIVIFQFSLSGVSMNLEEFRLFLLFIGLLYIASIWNIH